jgi:hypothetical protein
MSVPLGAGVRETGILRPKPPAEERQSPAPAEERQSRAVERQTGQEVR